MLAWSLTLDDPEAPLALGKRRFRKELIYTGQFQKDGRKFDVDAALLDHWDRTFDVFKEKGIAVPLPLGHTTDPEMRRGTVVDLERGKNKRGKESLFGIIEFKDDKAEDALLASQVSIFVPPSFTDGEGTVYHRPITHVAVTDYPVVLKLDEWEVLAASLSEGDMSMSLRSLADKLKIAGDDARDDVAIESRIVALFKSLKESISDLKKKAAPEPAPEPKPVAASHLSMLKDNRSLKLDSLVTAGKLTPAARKKIEERWCSKDALTLAFSNEEPDGFDHVLAVFAENEPVISFAERSHGQTLVDPSVTDPAKNPILRDAAARQKQG